MARLRLICGVLALSPLTPGCSDDVPLAPAGSGSTTAADSTGGSDTQVCDLDEVCDGIDNDCDGEVDEDCQCTEGDTQPCFDGDPALAGVGECAQGTQTCQPGGTWGECQDQVLPGAETCNGLDDDCDGDIDDDFSSVTCGMGICQVMVDECVDGMAQPCEPGMPEDELCDRIDNDCDGEVDEDCECIEGEEQSCYSGAPRTQGVGLCQDGTQVCDIDGNWGPCEGDVTPVAELCDDLDNDCDGAVDNDDPEGGAACGTGLMGECAAGTETCVAGTIECVQDVAAAPELCDGLDNDCDGAADEGDPGGGLGCDTGQLGVCTSGTETCVGGIIECVQDVAMAPELCDGLDNDCDGVIDNGNPGSGGACNTGLLGVCSDGFEICQGGSVQCVQNMMPSPELCDLFDNDCDGIVDEGNPGGGGMCPTGLPGICGPGTWVCDSSVFICMSIETASPEICDGLDNDCDGAIDDGNPGGGNGCDTGLLGTCQAGVITCTGGLLECTQTFQPIPEVCGDGLDNDCDGVVDDGCPACPPGFTSCDADPDCETNTQDDGTNCGGCNIICGDNEYCDAGMCTPCAGDLRDCDDDGANACEVDIASDAVNCGGCGNVCGTPAGGLCCASTCQDGDANNCGACGEPCVEGMLVINELMNNPSVVGDGAGEWFELYNPNAFPVDVRGFVLSDLGADSHVVMSVDPIIVPAFGVAVLGNNDDPLANGGAPVAYQYAGIFLANGADEMIVTAYGQELDRVEWNAGFPQVGASQELSINHQAHVLNDAPGNWCAATDPFGGGDLGTPGLVNTCSL